MEGRGTGNSESATSVMPVVRPPPVATTPTVPAASRPAIAPSSAAAAPVSPIACDTRSEATAPRAPSLVAAMPPSRPSGSGSDQHARLERGEVFADLAHGRQEDLLAEQPRRRRRRGSRPRRRPGTGRGTGTVRVTRAPITAPVSSAAVSPRRSTSGRRPRRPRRTGPRSRCRCRVAAHRQPRRARSERSRPRWRRPRRATLRSRRGASRRASAPPELGSSPIAAARIAWLGPSANGGRRRSPPQSVDRSGFDAGRRRGRDRRPRPRASARLRRARRPTV